MAPHTFGRPTLTRALIPAVEISGPHTPRFAGGGGGPFSGGKKDVGAKRVVFSQPKIVPHPLQPPRAQATKPKPPVNDAYHPKPVQWWSGRHSRQPSCKPSPETSTAAGPAPAARAPHPPASPAAQTYLLTDESTPEYGYSDLPSPGWHR